MNDLRSLHKNKCLFLIEFCGALYEEGIVKIALEYMDMGSMKDIIKGARKLNKEWISSNKEACLIPESIMAKMI
jgi:hypothetical protein